VPVGSPGVSEADRQGRMLFGQPHWVWWALASQSITKPFLSFSHSSASPLTSASGGFYFSKAK